MITMDLKRVLNHWDKLFWTTWGENLCFYIILTKLKVRITAEIDLGKLCKYISFCSLIRYSLISLHISWFLLCFCFVWCLAHVSHSGSGSSHVLQKCVAGTCVSSVEQGSHTICFPVSVSLKIVNFNHFVCFHFWNFQTQIGFYRQNNSE